MDDKLIAQTIEPLDATKKAAVKKAFEKLRIALEAMADERKNILAQKITKEVCGDARSLRIRISKVRIDGEKWKTKEKSQFLIAGNAIQGLFNYLKKDTMKQEAELKEIEDHFELEAQRLIDEKKAERLKLLEPYEIDSTFVNLGNMTDEAWTAHFAGIVAAHEKGIEDAVKESEETKETAKLQRVFDERKERLLPYAQFNPFVDLHHETTIEEYDELLTLMKEKMQEFDDNQTQLFEENAALKEENKGLKAGTPEANKFKQDIFAGFSSGGAPTEKEQLSTEKDTSLGEMLGFDIPEEKEVIYNTKYDKEMDTPEETSPKTDKEILVYCADSLERNKQLVSNESAIQALESCINTLNGAAMII